MKQYVIGCDNAGVELKNQLIQFLTDQGIPCEDVGVTQAEDNTIYPDVAKRLVDRIAASSYQKDGILVCGTGIGMAITANKFPRIYAGVCHDSFSAERLRLSNNGNVICFGARIIGPELAKKILAEWLSLEFKDGSSTVKVERIKQLEQELKLG